MSRLRLVAAVSAAGVVVAIIVGLASPASASVPPAITVDSPAGNSVLTNQATISGNAAMPGSLDSIGNVAVSLISGPGSDLPAPCDPCSSGHGQSVSFSWSPSLARNGPYQARIAASGSQFIFGVLDGEATSETTASFRVEIPPVEPAGVRAEAGADQTVRVTWARNAEPDLLAYRVQRKDPGGAAFHDVGGAVSQPSSGSVVSITDPAVGPGGSFVYQVQAIRAGRSGDASTAVGSGFAGTQVTVPPGATGAPAPIGGSGAPPGGPARNSAPTPNLSAFLKGSGGGPTASVPAAPAIPDGTYQESLPFGIPPASKSGRAGDTIGLSADSAGNGTRAVLLPVAGGLLLCLVAFHVRRFNGWLTAAPTGAKPAGGRRREPESLPVIATGASKTEGESEPKSTPNWLVGITPLASEGRESAPIRKKKPATSLDYWSTPSTAADEAPEAPRRRGDAAAETDAADDDTKWAPITPPNGDAWEDILVKPGRATTRRG